MWGEDADDPQAAGLMGGGILTSAMAVAASAAAATAAAAMDLADAVMDLASPRPASGTAAADEGVAHRLSRKRRPPPPLAGTTRAHTPHSALMMESSFDIALREFDRDAATLDAKPQVSISTRILG